MVLCMKPVVLRLNFEFTVLGRFRHGFGASHHYDVCRFNHFRIQTIAGGTCLQVLPPLYLPSDQYGRQPCCWRFFRKCRIHWGAARTQRSPVRRCWVAARINDKNPPIQIFTRTPIVKHFRLTEYFEYFDRFANRGFLGLDPRKCRDGYFWTRGRNRIDLVAYDFCGFRVFVWAYRCVSRYHSATRT